MQKASSTVFQGNLMPRVVGILLMAQSVSACLPPPGKNAATAQSMVGSGQTELVEAFGSPDYRHFYLPSNSCEADARTCPRAWPAFQSGPWAVLPRDKPVTLLTFREGETYTVSTPTRAVTQLSGTTGYTTVFQGTESTVDTRCTLKFALVDGVVRAFETSGTGC